MGCQVRQVGSGAEALKVLDQVTPALIITDFMMPDMNGVELCRAIRQRADTQSTPIMLRSYRVLDTKLIEEAKIAGADDVMHLLVVQRDFIPRVRALLAKNMST
jgi:two-component system phosphate regulon response regulator PhoB